MSSLDDDESISNVHGNSGGGGSSSGSGSIGSNNSQGRSDNCIPNVPVSQLFDGLVVDDDKQDGDSNTFPSLTAQSSNYAITEEQKTSCPGDLSAEQNVPPAPWFHEK